MRWIPLFVLLVGVAACQDQDDGMPVGTISSHTHLHGSIQHTHEHEAAHEHPELAEQDAGYGPYAKPTIEDLADVSAETIDDGDVQEE
jgi:hypothetical protein